MIERSDEHTFHLTTDFSSYLLQLAAGAVPVLRHWGPRLGSGGAGPAPGTSPPAYAVAAGAEQAWLHLESLSQEYGLAGAGDFRRPAMLAVSEDGFPVTGLAYRGHRIYDGAAVLDGLPAAREPEVGGAQTLELDLVDAVTGLSVVLGYTVLERFDAVARHVQVRNEGAHRVSLERLASASLDLPARERRELLTLTGGWGRERHITRTPLSPGVFATESTRGTSSHVANPFMALVDPATDESAGEVFAAALIYSGNFLAEVDASLGVATPRLNIGINPQGFRWVLDPGETLTSPQAVLVFTAEGLDGMSRRFHDLVRESILPPAWSRRERPVLLNTWEAQYFDVSHDTVLELADAGTEVGVELLVLDDGWFAARNDDTTSLGDWRENPEKLPGGLSELSRRLHERDLGFGLWVEPEMISTRSELYRAHPEWCLEIPARGRGENAPLGRNQLVLDLGRSEVQQWIIDTFAALFARAGADYVKWDMNRSLAPAVSTALDGARRGESAHRYVLGLYRVVAELTARFPDILFEGCAGGGGRFDLGMLSYMPQTWTSDNTDALSRIYIQYGTSLVYPPVTMAAHVSAVPNHQTGRSTALLTRAAVAMSANFGLELDPRSLSRPEREALSSYIAFYKRHRMLIQQGRMHRLESPFTGNRAAWLLVDSGAEEALVFVFRLGVLEPGAEEEPVCLRGLAPDALYEDTTSGRRERGAVLSTTGLVVQLPGGEDAAAVRHLVRV